MKQKTQTRQYREHGRAVRGFSLAEVMVVIALLVIMGLIATIFSGQLTHSLTMMQRNACAQQIYDVMQSRLSVLQSQGRLEKLEDAVLSDGGAKITSQPRDWAGKQAVSSWDDYDLVNTEIYNMAAIDETGGGSDVSAVALLKVSDLSGLVSTDVSNGYFVVEMSPLTAEVYAVWYWEADAQIGSTPGPSLNYGSISGLRVEDENQFINARSEATVGYYGGNPVSKTSKELLDIDVTNAELTLVNGEELYAHIDNMTINSSRAGNPNVFRNGNFYVSMNVKDAITGSSRDFNFDATEFVLAAGSNRQVSFSYDNTAPLPSNRYACSVDIILDSMREGMSFQELVNEKGSGTGTITPGHDVIVTAAIRYGDAYKAGIDDSANSLFAESSLYSGVLNNSNGSSLPAPSGNLVNYDKTDTIEVNRLRHLNNLRNLKSGDYVTKSSGLTINQTANLTFIGKPITQSNGNVTTTAWRDNWGAVVKSDGTTTKEYPSVSSQTVALASVRTGEQTKNLNFLNVSMDSGQLDAAAYFAPIENALVNEHSYITYSAAIDGADSSGDRSFDISDITIKRAASTAQTALFATMADHASIQNIDIINPQVTSTSDYSAVLIGRATSTISSIDSCVLSGAIQVTGAQYTGSLVGKSEARCEISNCTVGTPAQPASVSSTVSGADSRAGGIIGQSTSAEGDSCSIQNISFIGSVTGDGNYVGGIAGASFNTSFENCSVATTGDGVVGDSYTGGLSGGAYGNTSVSGASGGSCVVSGTIEALTTASGGSLGFVGGRLNMSNCFVGAEGAGINVTAAGEYAGGLVGNYYQSAGTITDCTVHGSVNANSRAGGAIGHATGEVTLERCYAGSEQSAISVSTTQNYAGGLVGSIDSTAGSISDSAVYGSVGSYSNAGGAVGYAAGSLTMVRCNTGSAQSGISVNATQDNAGGLVGDFASTAGSIANCTVHGTVGCKHAAGGLIGWNSLPKSGSGCAISNCTIGDEDHIATVQMVGSGGNKPGRIGGLIGIKDAVGSVSNCTVFANVSGYENSGGVVGYADKGTFTDCGIRGKTGDVNGAVSVTSTGNNVGGFAGILQSSVVVERCYAAAKVLASNSNDNVGGFVGSTGATIRNSYSASAQQDEITVNGRNHVGGFAGSSNRTAVFTSCYSTCVARGQNTGIASFIGFCQTPGANLKNCISYAKYFKGSNRTGRANLLGNFYENNTEDVDSSNKYWVWDDGATTDQTTDPVPGTPKKTYGGVPIFNGDELKVLTNPAGSASPYDPENGNKFLFTLVTSTHYGDWRGGPVPSGGDDPVGGHPAGGLQDDIASHRYYLFPNYSWNRFVDDFYHNEYDVYGFIFHPATSGCALILVGNDIYALTSRNEYGSGKGLTKDDLKALVNNVTGEVDTRLTAPTDGSQPFLVKLDLSGTVYDWGIDGQEDHLPAGKLVFDFRSDGTLRYVSDANGTGNPLEIPSELYTRIEMSVTNPNALAKGDAFTITYSDGARATIRTTYIFAELHAANLSDTAGSLVQDASGNLYIRCYNGPHSQEIKPLPDLAYYTSPERWTRGVQSWDQPFFYKIDFTSHQYLNNPTGSFTVAQGDIVRVGNELRYVTANGNQDYYPYVVFNTSTFTYTDN